MVDIINTDTIYGQRNPELHVRVKELVLSIPDKVFYSGEQLYPDGCKFFNLCLISELTVGFRGSLHLVQAQELDGYYSYPVDILTAVFRVDSGSEYAYLFVPDSKRKDLPLDDATPWEYVIKHMRGWIEAMFSEAKIKGCDIIGYSYPICSKRYEMDASD